MALTTVKSDQIQTSVALAGSPTTTTQSASDNSTKVATTAYVETAVANLVASAPAALNTLDELAAALNDDASFSTTITNSIATKLPLAGGTMSGALNMGSQNITNAGTIAGTLTTAAQTNITSLGTLSSLNVGAITSTGKFSLNDSTYGGWIQSNTSVRIDIDNDNNQTDRAFIVSKNNGATSLLTILENTAATFAGNISIDAASGNPYVSIKTAGTGNNPFTEYRAGNNTVFDTAAIFSGTTDRFRIGYGASGSISTDLFSITQGGDTTIAGGLAVDTTTFNVDNTNNRVGIGTATPQRLLTLFENDQPVFQITNNTSGGQSTRGLIQYMASGTTTAIFDNQGSGSGGQLTFMQAGATRMVIDTNGNVNIGGKDTNTHNASVDSLQVGYALNLYEDSYNTGTDNYVFLANNAYYSSGGNKYMRTDEASRFYQNAGNFYFQNAPSGTAGTAISFATRMAITAAGLVGIGRVPAFAQLEVQGDKTLANSLQLQLNGATDSNKQMIMGFDTTANKSYIISQIAGSARKELQMNVETLIVDNNLNDKIARFVTTHAQGITVGTSATDSAGRAVHLAHDGTGSGYLHPYNYAGSSFDAMEIRASNTAIKKADGNTALNVDAAGIVTQEYLPAFHAYYNANTYSPSNNTVFAHNATRFDNGGNYDTTNHRFTAPVAGVYQIYFRTIIYGSGNNGHISFRINGAGAAGANGHYSFAINAWNVFEMHMLKDLAANDYVDVYNNSRTVSYYHGNAWNEFSGYLVG